MTITALKGKPDAQICFILVLAVIIYSITAYFSVGYYHPDEHYQIIEFANFKLGNIRAADLPWEYRDKIRSSFMPWLAYFDISACRYFGITSPYAIAFTLRLFTAFLSLSAITFFIKNVITGIHEKLRPVFIVLSYFLWFIPFINVRFSSECWCGIFLLAAVSFLVNQKRVLNNYTFILAGMALGISFLCRYHAGVCILALLLWLHWVRRVRISGHLLLLSGFIIVLLGGLLLDKLFYKTWTLTAYNYFYENIIQDKASTFGTQTWYSFLLSVFSGSFYPIGFLIFGSFVVFVIFESKSIIVWCTLPFIVMHLIIPHKEIRFLFPIINFLPFILVRSIEIVNSITKEETGTPISFDNAIYKAGFYLFFLVNSVCLVFNTFDLPSNGRIYITQYLFDNYKHKNLVLISNSQDNPFTPYSWLNQSFYKIRDLKEIQIDSYDSLGNLSYDSQNTYFLCLRGAELSNPKTALFLKNKHFQTVARGNPYLQWVSTIFPQFETNEYFLLRR
jgi:phosphatidylinositol glycan class B